MTCVEPTPLPNAEALPDDVLTLQRMILELLELLRTERHAADGLRHRLDELLRRMFGKRSEKLDPNQLLLFPELLEQLEPEAPASETAAAAEEEAKQKKKKPGHGRRRLPEHLPREIVIHDLSETEKLAIGGGLPLVKIGEEISEQLEYTPAIFKVLVHIRLKYAVPVADGRAGAAQIIRAAMPAQAIDKGLPGPGLLAHIAVSKYADHLPLYRLEGIFARVGVDVSRQTMCGWMAHGAELLAPVYRRMIERLKASKKIHTDDTTVPVLDPQSDRTKTGRLWVYLGDDERPYTVFDYTPNHTRDGPTAWLEGFTGYLQADAFSGYDGIYLDKQTAIVEVACWAHARRKFFEARTSDAARSMHALALIGQLYAVEREAKERAAEHAEQTAQPLPTTEFHALRWQLRQEKAKPVMDQIVAWFASQSNQVLPKSPLGLALTYAKNQLGALQRYLEDGMLEIDNNVAERAIKNVVIGRKNWLFAGSDNGGNTAATFFSLTVTCKRLGINPWAYLRDVFDRISTHPANDLDALLPDQWAQANRAVPTHLEPSGPASPPTNPSAPATCETAAISK